MSDNPLEENPARDQLIRERAYALWEADGKPHGNDAEYWERARELVGMSQSAGAGQIAVPDPDSPSVILGQPVEEAAIQDNLGEFPGRQADQGERQMTPRGQKEIAPVVRASSAHYFVGTLVAGGVITGMIPVRAGASDIAGSGLPG